MGLTERYSGSLELAMGGSIARGGMSFTQKGGSYNVRFVEYPTEISFSLNRRHVQDGAQCPLCPPAQ